MIDQLHKTFSGYYNAHCADHTRPYDGISELLSDLHKAGIRTAVVSNKPDEDVKPLCEEFFPGMFATAVGERKGVRRKPAPDSVLAVINLYYCCKLPKKETLPNGKKPIW